METGGEGDSKRDGGEGLMASDVRKVGVTEENVDNRVK